MGSQWARKLMIVGLAMVVLAVVSIPVFNLLIYTPAATAREYLTSLARGNAERALNLLSAPPAEPGNALSDEILSNAPTAPSHVSVEESTTHEDGTADVLLAYNLGSNHHTTTFHLERSRDTWGLYQTWKIVIDEWPKLNMDVSGASVASVNGQPVPVAGQGVPVFFPLEYSVGFNAEFLEAPAQRATVTQPGETPEVSLTAQPTGALVERVETVINEQIDECVAQKTLKPSGCGFGYETQNDILGEVTWKVEKYPTIELETAPDGLKVVASNAALVVSGRYRDSVTAFESDFSETVTTPITATVEVVNDEVVVDQTEATIAGT